jgi:hypothetical protein
MRKPEPRSLCTLQCRNPLFLLAVGLCLFGTQAATAQDVIFNNVRPGILTSNPPVPGGVVSSGFEAGGLREFGDGLVFVGTSREITSVTVVMASYACVSGHWDGTGGLCVSYPDTGFAGQVKFSQPITLNIYTPPPGCSSSNIAACQAPPGPLLASLTQTFQIPYRPSADPTNCPNAPNQWFDINDSTCYDGLAVPITFDLSGMTLGLLSSFAPNSVVLGVTFNTSTAGYHPIGTNTACFATVAGCPYDSLNVSSDQTSPGLVGSNIDPNGNWANYINAATSPYSCPGAVSGVFQDDTPCQTTFHPEFLVTATPLNFYTFLFEFFADASGGGRQKF